MGTLVRELKLAVRALSRRPGFTAVAVLTLGLGIGANAAIFSLVDAILLRPLPFPDSDRVVTIRHHAPGLDLDNLNNSPGTIRLYREHAQTFSSLGAYTGGQRNLTGGAEPARVRTLEVTPGLFPVLNVRPRLGRPFSPPDVERDAAPVAILTDAAWKSRFGEDPRVLGTTVQLDGITTEIVGVMPPEFRFPEPGIDALMPLYVDPEGAFGEFGTELLGRLAPGVTVEQARQHVADLQVRVTELDPELTPDFLAGIGWSSSVERLRDVMVRNVRSTLWLVLGAVAFVLLIACANVANLFLVRAEDRRKEMAIREAMGGNRGRLAVGYVSESLVLGAGGGLVGVLLASLAVDFLVAREVADLPRLSEVVVDGRVLAFTFGLSILAGVTLGLLPLVSGFARNAAAGLSAGDRRVTSGRERNRTRDLLVAGQLALAMVLLVGSGLMLRSFAKLRAVDPGLDPDGVVTVGLSYGEADDVMARSRFYREVAERTAALPGVERVSLTSGFPFSEGSVNGGSFYVESRPRADDDIPPVAMYKPVSSDYFEVLRTPVLEGRTITSADIVDGRALAWVNETFARTFLDGSALGERIRFDEDEDEDWAEIVGVVGDAREFGLGEAVRPMVYLPLVVGNWGYPHLERMYLVIRTEREVLGLAEAVRHLVREVDPRVPVLASRTMTSALAASVAETSYTLVLLAIAATVALLLGAVGLFGVISYVVGQRTREIGVRIALGARAEDVVSLFLRHAVGVTAIGVAAGVVAALALTRLMGSVLYEVSATDPVSFAVAPVLLVAVAMLATWLPTRRATRVEPVRALRAE